MKKFFKNNWSSKIFYSWLIWTLFIFAIPSQQSEINAGLVQHRHLAVLAAKPSFRSNGSFLDLDCSSLTGWTDSDKGQAESTQVTYDGESTFKFDTKISAAPNDYAIRSRDHGSLEGVGNRVVISLRIYHVDIGTSANTDLFRLQMRRTDLRLIFGLASDNLYIHDASTSGQNTGVSVSEGVWQEWTFDVDLSSGVANATCDIYRDGELKASAQNCDDESGGTDGEILIQQYGYANDDQVSNLDWLKIGNGFQ